jgi:predicted PurR-regulated permease PerM
LTRPKFQEAFDENADSVMSRDSRAESTQPSNRSSEGSDVDTHRWPPLSYWAKVSAVVLLVALSFALLWLLRSVALVLVASLVLAIGLQPSIRWLERRGLGRGWALAVILLAGLIVMIGVALVLVPFLIDQVAGLVEELPAFIERLRQSPGVVGSISQSIDLESLTTSQEGQGGAAPAALGLVSSLGGTLFNVVTILAVTPYLAIRLPQIKVWVARLLRPRHREDFLFVLNESTDLIANYIVGNLVLSLIAGVVSFVGFQLIGVRFALVLAAWVAFTDLIPVVGAFIGAAGVAAVAAFQGPGVVVAAVALLLAYQLVENFVIAPRVMNRAVDLSPVTVIVAIMIGGSLAGLFGALLALPVAAMIKIIVIELLVPERIDEVRRDSPTDGRQTSRRRASRPLP